MKLLATIIIIATAALPASARVISWFNAEGDVLAQSDATMINATYTFEIGSFGSFTPLASNLSDWQANWKVFDRAVSGDGWNATTGYFTSSAEILASGLSSAGFDARPFSTGETAFLWVYNSLDLLPSSEWALVRDSSNVALSPSWSIPVSDAGNPSSLDWDLLEADTAVWGGVNGARGGGSYDAIPGLTLSDVWLQTSPVPEPGSALLVLIATAACLRRRRAKS